MRHLRWSILGLCVTALAACDSTPVDPAANGPGQDGGMTVTASIVGAVPVPYEADGHLYDAVEAPGGISWTAARAAAEGLTSGSCQGYLASVTSADEDAFIRGSFTNVVPSVGGVGYWIGGYQDESTFPAEAGWMWVSGEDFVYDNWLDDQPDDAMDPFGLTQEDAIHYAAASDGGFGSIPGWADRNRDETAPGYVVEFDGVCTEAALIEVMLKLSQGEGVRNINLESRGKIAVAVLSTEEFDATTIDPATVTLGDGADPEAPVASNPHEKFMMSWPDLDEDGLADALFHFNTEDLVTAGLTLETTELVIHGMTHEGVEFSGMDAVSVH
jgi:hypothetical protein